MTERKIKKLEAKAIALVQELGLEMEVSHKICDMLETAYDVGYNEGWKECNTGWKELEGF